MGCGLNVGHSCMFAACIHCREACASGMDWEHASGRHTYFFDVFSPVEPQQELNQTCLFDQMTLFQATKRHGERTLKDTKRH